MTIRVVLADDQPLLRTGFRMILHATEDLQVVGEAGDGAQAVTVSAEQHPDVVLMDVRMPSVDGIEATRQIVRSGADCRILILTTFDLDEYAFAALRAGASGFLLKDVPPEELTGAIRAVARGDAVVSPRVTRQLLDRIATRLPDTVPEAAEPGRHPLLQPLTGRESEVFMKVAAGLTNAEIAAELVLSEATVKTHVTRILGKLDLRDRVQAVVAAYEHGVVGRGGNLPDAAATEPG